MASKRVLLWFRNDLRLHDNYMVQEAVRQVKAGSGTEVVPVFCFDPRSYARGSWGLYKSGAKRSQFQLESVVNLKQNLRKVGSDLLITVGKPEEIFPGLLQGCEGKGLVFTQQETTSEEANVEKQVIASIKGLGKLQRIWGLTMFHLDDLPFNEDLSNLPDIFTPFREKVEARCQVRKDVPLPTSGQLPLPSDLPPGALEFVPTFDDLPYPQGDRPAFPEHEPRGVMPFAGGEDVALQRLKHYLWDTNAVASYFDTRNGMLGPDYSTKFSPWLAHGCLSPRRVYHEIRRYEKERTANKSTYWVIFELIWRDFFRFFSLKHGNRIFFEYGITGASRSWNRSPDAFDRWCKGCTGMPLVDANMRELNATGFMSNRGRQNVASYLVLDLGVDWRRGADYFESLLLDYDVASNWGNWVAAAGLTGGRINKFNIPKQSKDYDLNGDYIRHWLPELANVPASRIHEPWLMSKAEAQEYGVELGVTYPTPMQSRFRSGGDGHGGSGGGGGRGGGRSGGPGRGPQDGPRSSGGRRLQSGTRQSRKSAFEMYG